MFLVKSMNSRWPNKFSLSLFRHVQFFQLVEFGRGNRHDDLVFHQSMWTFRGAFHRTPALRVHKCVLYNYVHVFALFRGSLCLFSLCVSGVVLASPCSFLLTQRDIKGSGAVFL